MDKFDEAPAKAEPTGMDRRSKEPQRPPSVETSGGLLIIFAIIWLGTLLPTLSGGDFHLYSQIVMGQLLSLCIPAGVQLIAGIGILKGRRWALMMFYIILPVAAIIGIASEGRLRLDTILFIALNIVVAVLLNRP